jgi:hypothetical protein
MTTRYSLAIMRLGGGPRSRRSCREPFASRHDRIRGFRDVQGRVQASNKRVEKSKCRTTSRPPIPDGAPEWIKFHPRTEYGT